MNSLPFLESVSYVLYTCQWTMYTFYANGNNSEQRWQQQFLYKQIATMSLNNCIYRKINYKLRHEH